MDDVLKQLAAVALALGEAEAALETDEAELAREKVFEAGEGLAVLRSRWSELDARQRAVLGAAAQPVRERLDAVAARVPKRVALSVGAAESDPEQDADPLAQ